MLTLLRTTLRWTTLVSAHVYLVGVSMFTLFVRYYPGDSWVGALALYLPRQVFLVPIPCLALALWLIRCSHVLWTQALALGVVLFPLMGFTLPRLPTPGAASPTLRILSFNVDSGYSGVSHIVDSIVSIDADVVAIQEAKGATEELKLALTRHYRYVEEQPYSLLCSRFPVLQATDHDKIPIDGWPRSGRFQRHVIQLPSGPVAFYNVHPISPRGALNIHRFRGAFHAFRTGQAINQESISALEYNTKLRRLQIEAVAKLARAESYPVILAGDFNVPYLGQAFHSNLDAFQDGFRVAGTGFGYTFPSRFAWMRLDRVLASYDLGITDFEVDCKGLSDHFCVVAEVRAK